MYFQERLKSEDGKKDIALLRQKRVLKVSHIVSKL